MKLRMSLVLSLCIVIIGTFFVAYDALAQSVDVAKECDGIKCLVPCNGPECQTCSLVKLGNNVVKWLVGFLSAAGALVFAYGGFLMVTSAGDMGKVSHAKELMTNVVVGLVIMLSGFLVVDTVLKSLVNKSILGAETSKYGPWNTIQCVPQPDFTNKPSGTVSVVPSGTAGCPTCVKIDSSVATCKNPSSCTVSKDYYEKLEKLTTDIEITEGYPPTRVHQNACHTAGTCTDVVFADRKFTPDKVAAFQAEAARAGLRAVFEPGTDYNGGSCNGLSDCQPYSVTKATGSHFSLYIAGGG